MLKAILFDLDNTLLGNDVDRFLQHYLPLISAYVSDFMPAEVFARELLVATQVAIANQEPTLTNEALFWQAFTRRNAVDVAALEARLEMFYAEQFGQLQSVTQRIEGVADLLAFCETAALPIVVATNPLFPRTAIEQRLAWAGVPVHSVNYALITTFENMHAAKPSHAYYNEIVAQLSLRPAELMMVGDDWLNDIVPAAQLGMATFWIADSTQPLPDNQATPDGQGTLAALFQLLQSGWLLSG